MEVNFPKNVDFVDSLVGFIDLLGFDHRIRAIQNPSEFFEIGKLLYTIKVTADNLNNSNDILKDFKLKAISDSLIVSVPFKDPICTVGLLHLLHNIQYELIATSFQTIIRGYINRGPIYHKGGLLFGAGYSGAYKGEGMIGNRRVLGTARDMPPRHAVLGLNHKEWKSTCKNTRTHVFLVILKGGMVIRFMSLMTDLNGNLYHTPILTHIVTGHGLLSGEMVAGII